MIVYCDGCQHLNLSAEMDKITENLKDELKMGLYHLEATLTISRTFPL